MVEVRGAQATSSTGEQPLAVVTLSSRSQQTFGGAEWNTPRWSQLWGKWLGGWSRTPCGVSRVLARPTGRVWRQCLLGFCDNGGRAAVVERRKGGEFVLPRHLQHEILSVEDGKGGVPRCRDSGPGVSRLA